MLILTKKNKSMKVNYFLALAVSAFLLYSCGEEGQKTETTDQESTDQEAVEKEKPQLVYSSVNDVGEFLGANVKIKGEEKDVFWFHFLDNEGDADAIGFYDNAPDKVDKYPANITENENIYMLIADRFEIRIVADSENDKFKNTQKLKDFINQFDLDAMEAFDGEKLNGEGLRQFIPTLEVVE